MQAIFNELMNTHITPFFKANGFETKDINSETNRTLGIQSHYFYCIEGDLNRNFYFESNSDNTAEKYEFKVDFGIYPYSLFQAIGFPHNDAPNSLGNLYYVASEDIFSDKSLWQSLNPKTDMVAFVTALLSVLKSTLDTHKTVDSVDTLMAFCTTQKSNAYHYNYIIRYLKVTEKAVLLDKYVAALRTADGSPLPDWMMQDVTALLDTTILKQKVINNFTKGIKVPKAWEIVLDWSEKNIGKVIGGHFEITENSNNMLTHVVDINGKAAKQLAVIGESGADSILCLWQKDKKNAPIVMLGESGSARVIAEHIDDFVQLLAVGYYEIEVADYHSEPVFPVGAEHWKNPEFQTFYKKKFKKEIPKTGAEIMARITTSDSDFLNWLCDNDEIWKPWRK
jgi:hypothetical protein